MTRLRIAFPASERIDADETSLEALDVSMALTVVDINLPRGAAEIWDGETRLARLVKLGDGKGTFWQLR